ncbi:MAG: WG repeat-containing protein, partial [Saprospiraceae bacterium]|nr:WG repeat-containing protein [Saprospiraceae bacterium]
MFKNRLYISLVLALLFHGQPWAQTLFPVKVNKKWGLINQEGKLVTQTEYDAIGEFKASGLAIMQKKGKVGVLDLKAQEVVPASYEDIKVLSPDLFSVKQNAIWKVINLAGDTIVQSGYDHVEVWFEDFLGYMIHGKWGMVSAKGAPLAAPIYDKIFSEDGYFFKTEIDGKVGVIDRMGNTVLEPMFDEITILDGRVIFCKDANKWGAVNIYGNEIVPVRFDAFTEINPGFLKLYEGAHQYLFSTLSGQILTEEPYDNFFAFSRHYVLVKNNRLLGLMDDCGNWILSPIYNEIQHYGQHYFRVNYQGMWGIVDEGDRQIIPQEFDYVAPLKSNFCLVKKNNLFGVCNPKGKLVVPTLYQRIEIENRQAKAYLADSLSIYDFDPMGNLIAEGNFGEHFTITIGKKKPSQPVNNSIESAFVLKDFEWFYSPETDKWGLRKLNDGNVQIDPIFDFVKVIKDLNLTLVGINKSKKLVFDRTTYRFDMVFGLVDNRTGALITEMNLWDIRFDDFRKGYPLARCIFENGRHGLILKTGTVLLKDFIYIGEFSEGMARVSMKGKLSGSMDGGKESLVSINDFLGNLSVPNRMTDFTAHDLVFNREADLICEDCTWGFIDTLGRMVIQPQFEYAMDCLSEVIICKYNEKWGAVNFEGKQLIPFEFDDIHFLEQTGNRIIRVYKREEKYGLIDTSGQIKISAVFDEIGSFSEGKLAVKRNNFWGFVNKLGQEIVPCRFQKVENFSEGLAAVKIGNNWGFTDRLGDLAIPANFKRVGNFSNGLAWAVTNNGLGFINTKGEMVIPEQFQRAFDFKFGVAIIMQEGKFGLIDPQGNFILKPKYPEMEPFDNMGLSVVRYGSENVRYGLVNLKGELITTQGYREIRPFKEGMAAVRTKNGFGFVNLQGQQIINDIYSKVSDFSEGKAAVQLEGNCGYIDKEGKYLAEPQYSKCLDYKDGVAVVYRGIKNAGLLDSAGNTIIEPQINRLLDFSEGRGLVRDSSYNFYYITEQAKPYDGYYQKAGQFNDGVAVVQVDGKWGIINQKGIEIIPPKYDKIESFEDGYAKVRIQGFNGLASLNGD